MKAGYKEEITTMLKVNGYEGNYNSLYIYNDDAQILFQTNRPYELNIVINATIRSARKLILNKHDCFEIKTSGDRLFTNGKDLYVHDSVIAVLGVEEKVALKCHGETNYKDVYTLELRDGSTIKVESDYYTRSEKDDDRLYREKLASIMSECMYTGKDVSHYEVEEMLKRLNITIREEN